MFLFIWLLSGYASFGSGSGTLNLYSARTLPMANLAVNLHMSYSRHQYPSQEEYEISHHIGKAKIGITYGVWDYLELYAGTTVYGKGEQLGGFSEPEDVYMFGDEDFYGGMKFYLPIIDNGTNSVNWLIGGNIGGKFTPIHSDKDDSLCLDQHFEPTLKHGADFSFDFLNDIEIYPLFIHLNLGYEIKGNNKEIPLLDTLQGAYFLEEERSDLFKWGVGFEIAAGKYTRFILETRGSNPTDTIGVDTTIASLGLRFITAENLTFDIGVDYALNDVDFVPDWEGDGNITSRVEDLGKWRFKVGFTTGSALIKKKEKPKIGVIALSVRDIDTDEPLTATVSFRDTTLGIFRVGEEGTANISLPPGVYHLKISREGYVPREASVTVKADAEINISTVLRKEKKPKGMFTGTVTSYREKTPLAATIELLGTKLKSITSDPEKGIFKGELPAGTYNVRVSSDGYIQKTFPVEIKDGETAIKNIQLIEKLEEKKKLILRGVNFASGKSVIPADGYFILEQVVEVLKANKGVKVEISGHTDAVGSASYNQRLSEARAQSVRQFLIQHGIDASRLTARGYGESNPIAPNTTRDGRALNRRIEFTVISN